MRRLTEAGTTFLSWYDNPNIEPEQEYQLRRDTFFAHARQCGLSYLEGDYEPKAFHEAIALHAGVFPLSENDAERKEALRLRRARCAACYRLRFTRLAQAAHARNIPSIATTLSVSPWQFTDLMASEMERAAALYGLTSAFADYRADYLETTKRSRECGMYRQNYCGCSFSRREAELERAARKAHRQAAKASKQSDSR
jgi:predicted adenine nucleotide alpha hydrolase (AANH) superfamily ATPase